MVNKIRGREYFVGLSNILIYGLGAQGDSGQPGGPGRADPEGGQGPLHQRTEHQGGLAQGGPLHTQGTCIYQHHETPVPIIKLKLSYFGHG